MFDDLKPTDAEKRLIAAAATGEIANFATGDAEQDDPKNAGNWGNDRIIRAEIIYALATGARDNWPTHPKGIGLIGARIVGPLDLESATVPVPLFFRACEFLETITLMDARLADIFLSGCVLQDIDADRAAIKGSVFLTDGFTAKGTVRLPGAMIGGELTCEGGQFEDPDGDALNGDGATIKGDVDLAGGFSAKGAVKLLGAEIGGDLNCRGGQFENHDGNALTVDRTTIKGSVFLTVGFSAKGAVRLLGAEIGGDFNCRGGQFENLDGNALSADGVTIKGNVFLTGGFSAKGAVRLSGTEIGGTLNCGGGQFENPNGRALVLQNTAIRNNLLLELCTIDGGLDLQHAYCGILVDDRTMWPAVGKLFLDGFTYGALAGNAPIRADQRIDWLNRRPAGPYEPQPFEQLVKVMRAMGHERDARIVAIEKQRALRKYGDISRRAKWWNLFLEKTIGHGYQPWKVLMPIAVTLLMGLVLFGAANDQGAMRPSKERVYLSACYKNLSPECVMQGWQNIEFNHPNPPVINLPTDYPKFQVFAYAFDVLVPFVDLHQESYWLPTSDTPGGWFFRFYMWLHIALGWILTTIGVVGLTGIIKQD